MLDLIAAAGIGGIIGFGTCALLTAGRITDLEERLHRYTVGLTGVIEWKQSLIDRALEQITPGSNATVKRIARILRGEQG